MTNRPTPQAGILDIAAYVPGRSSTGKDSGSPAIKLSSNESPLGASPKAIAALQGVAKGLASYPEGSSQKLRDALAEIHGLEAEKIVVGAGSDELLHLIAQTYLGSGDEAVISEFGFLMYPIVTKGAGATPVIAADADYKVDVGAMLAAVSAQTKIVFLANPNNPTGTYLTNDELVRLHTGLRADILFVIDSAYAEYTTADDYNSGADLVRAHDNVVMVRTFSKMGLAALRLGWMYGPDHIVDAINRLRDPFNVAVPAQLAGEAAVRDIAFTAELRAHNAKWRDWLSENLSSNHIRIVPSQGNFVLALFGADADINAHQANQNLLDAGIIVRELGGYGIDNGLRISIGDAAAMRAVVRVLTGGENSGRGDAGSAENE